MAGDTDTRGPKTVTVSSDQTVQTAPRLTVAPSVTAEDGSVWVHEDYQLAVAPWAVEDHIPPTNRKESFGDVESWAAYVRRYADPGAQHVLITWHTTGLRAILDYPVDVATPNRCQWFAQHPFNLTSRWRAWAALANGQAVPQRKLVEALEDLSEDIVEPDAASVVEILRLLRATSTATAETELQADGGSRVAFSRDSRVLHTGDLHIPPIVTIAIPVLEGDAEERDGRLQPVLYRLPVRLRPSVDDQAHLAVRLSLPTAERVLEEVTAARFAAARAALGEGYELLRG